MPHFQLNWRHGIIWTFIFISQITLASIAIAQSTDTPPVTEPTPAVAPFPDVAIGSEYFQGITYLKNLELIQGYPDGNFRPKQLINRAEALKILVGAIKFQMFSPVEKPLIPASTTTPQSATNTDSVTTPTNTESTTSNTTSTPPTSPSCPFPDLDPQSWYFTYICQAFKNQVVNGYPDNTFKPEQTINKVEALKMTLLQSGIPLDSSYNDNFDDISPSDWFWNYAKIANQTSIIVEDRQGKLIPDQQLNRGDFSMLIYRTLRAFQNKSEFGRATFYGGRFEGKSTASGEVFAGDLDTAAHKTLPFNTIVRVTNLANGKSVDVRINDRGPYVNGTIIDLSTTAFAKIASLSSGVIHTEVEILK